jgi:hypothetical protein
MTIGQLVESMFGKVCLHYGTSGDCTAFENKGSKHELLGNMLNESGLHKSGNEILYNGMTGEQIESEIFIGPNYYMRLKHMVKDKINYRAQGPRTLLTRQTVQGRANDGGLRIGEMERDGLIAHGATKFIQESFMVRGDEYSMAVCNTSGCTAIYNIREDNFYSLHTDGNPVFSNDLHDSMKLKSVSRYGRNFSIVKIPYSLKLLMQELQTMNIQMRIITEDNIEQFEQMNFGKMKLLHRQNYQDIASVYNKHISPGTPEDKELTPKSPSDLPPGSPPYAPGSSPAYDPNSPPYAPGSSPAYDPNSPPYAPGSPGYAPNTPDYPPGSPAYDPNSPPYNPNSTPVSSTNRDSDGDTIPPPPSSSSINSAVSSVTGAIKESKSNDEFPSVTMKIDTNSASKSLKLDSIQDLIKESNSKDKSVLEPEELEGKKESENSSEEKEEESSNNVKKTIKIDT